LARWCSTS